MNPAITRKQTVRNILRLIFAFAVAILITRKEIPALFNFAGASAEFLSPHEYGDIKIFGLLIAIITILCVVVLFFAALMAATYVILAELPAALQYAVGPLMVLIALLLNTSLPGVRQLFERESPVPPFNVYISPDKQREIQKYGKDRIRIETSGTQLRVTNLSKEEYFLRVDFYGKYGPVSNINCRGNVKVEAKEMPRIPPHQSYLVDEVDCGQAHRGYHMWLWNDSGAMVFHADTTQPP
jgi:hypothetical protein